MLQTLSHTSKQMQTFSADETFDPHVIWYDLIAPNNAEIEAIEKALNIHIPSLAEMSEIEESSRLFEEEGVLYMTSVLIAGLDSSNPISVPTTFIVTLQAVVTVRYADLKSFQNFIKKVARNGFFNAQTLFLGLMDTIVERVADTLEMNAAEIDRISDAIFKVSPTHNQRQMRKIMHYIGKIGDLNSKVRESLVTLDRQLIFYHNQIPEKTDKKILAKSKTIQHDVKSLVDYLSFLFSKNEFLLDATLGFVNIEQNEIIKFFSVAAVIFLPPMVIASIYGMNFHLIPELQWSWGYPFALIIMIISGVLPYFYFKRKGWL